MSRGTNNLVAGSGRDGGKDAGRLAAIDMLMQDIVHDKFRAVVREAIFGFEFLQENHLNTLVAAKEIPESFRAVYADMSKRRMTCSMRYTHAAFTVDRDTLPEYPASQDWCGGIEPEELPAISRVVEETNAAAADLRHLTGDGAAALHAAARGRGLGGLGRGPDDRGVPADLGADMPAGDDNREAVELVMHPPLHEHLLPDENRREVLDWNFFRDTPHEESLLRLPGALPDRILADSASAATARQRPLVRSLHSE